MKTTTQLRQLINSGKTMVKPGVYDALSARVMEKCGFCVVGISGYSVSLTLLGKPDLGFTSLTQISDVCRHVANAVNIPVIADADTGYGNAINVLYTTEELIKTGIAAFHMEDQEFPKRCGHVAGKKVISTEEMVGKIKAADKVRRELDKDFVIIARSDVRGTSGGSVQKLIDRCNAYMDAGADMIFPEGLLNEEELRQVAERVKAPIHFNRSGGKKSGGVTPFIPLSTLQEIGVNIVSQASGPMTAATCAMWEWGKGLIAHDVDFLLEEEAKVSAIPQDVGSFHLLSGMPTYLDMEKEFLPSEELKKYENTIGFRE